MSNKEAKQSGAKWRDLKLVGRLYGLAKPYWFLLSVSIILTLVGAYLGPLIPEFIQDALDIEVQEGDEEGLLNITMLILGLYLLNTAVALIRTLASNILAQNVVRDLRLKVYTYINKLKLKLIDRTPVGTLVTRNVSDIETLSNFFTEGAVMIAGDILQIIYIIYFMAATDVKLTLVSLSVLPLLLISAYIFKEKVRVSFTEVRGQVSKLNSFVQEHITGMQIVQIFNREKVELEKFKEINARHRHAHIKSVMYYSVFFPVVEIITAIAIALIIWYGMRDIITSGALATSAITFGVLVKFIMYINMFFRPVRQLADRFNSMQMGMVSAERIFKLVDETENEEAGGSLKTDSIKGDIRFENVWFAYKDEDWVLKDISFEVKEGKTLALVGATGAGKSSVINLITRFYDIQKGKIFLDNHSLPEYELEFLRKNIAVVLQDVFLFSGSIMDNVKLFNPEISDQKVIEACKAVGADSFIEKLPGKYNYRVMERGSSLSVGQRQLISFARALAFNPRILILDEATSSIDSETEELIQKAIELLMKGRTGIVIAHRLSTIRHADEILVLHKGNIEEKGTHQELLAKGGKYKSMYNSQFMSELLV